MVEHTRTCAHDRCHVSVFQKVPFSPSTHAFSNLSTLESVFKKFRFQCSKTSFRCRRKAKPNKNVAFTNLSGLVWTGTQLLPFWIITCSVRQDLSSLNGTHYLKLDSDLSERSTFVSRSLWTEN